MLKHRLYPLHPMAEQQLHLVVQVSDGRQMLATCAAGTAVRSLTEQLEDELAQTFRAALQLRYLGKVVASPEGGGPAATSQPTGGGGGGGGTSGGDGDAAALPPHFALSAAARAGDLLKDGDTVLAVAAEPPPPKPRDSGDGPEPELGSVAACAARWEELEQRAKRGRRHIASSLALLGPQEPRAVVAEDGRRLLGGLVGAGAAPGGEPALAQAAVTALAAATAIPQLAGLQAAAVLRSADDISRGAKTDRLDGDGGVDAEAAPTVASLLLSLCRAPSEEVRRNAEGVLRHLQAEARAEQARADPGYSKKQQQQQQRGGQRAEKEGSAGALISAQFFCSISLLTAASSVCAMLMCLHADVRSLDNRRAPAERDSGAASADRDSMGITQAVVSTHPRTTGSVH